MARMHDDEIETDVALASRLIGTQFPQWAHLPVSRVDAWGTDNAIYRLGDELSVRMPRIHWAVAPIEREFEWLPRLAPNLPVDVPTPIALGRPADGYPWPWTICRWVAGEHPADGGSTMLARDLARFVHAMRALDPGGAPITAWPRPLHVEDELVRSSLVTLADELRPVHEVVVAIWEEALAAARWTGPPTWIHGDLSPGNILVRDGRLGGVLDFSSMGLGDPASDYRVAWNLLSPAARGVFREGVRSDDATWARARGWVLLQALAQLPYYTDRHPALAANARRVIAELVAERRDRE